ncbi:fatty acid desaturase [filamentous cyanobacterium LEGE 11480]|uniref:Fatty acid desaturase n=1 Tax=Romeriopsis navalis LEGE 11480 TaxID=2777977 RepID=A0A928Z0R0_9CYAN|nr:fatty acid desaturase [Romeriopsis navalis]MBE9028531.1 fatty acid desaturase [Romeriopsis navalis LEGE 11480]
MNNVIRKSDFVLQPYMKSSDFRASYQILNTVVPYLLLWGLAVKAASVSLWLLPPIMVVMVMFSARCFSLMHDCGHYSLFNSKWANRIVGFALGVLNAIPHYPWSRGHAYHHKTNGDWERYRGPSGLMSTTEFAQLTPTAQRNYALLRHPLMLIPGGFFYLAVKPRLALILGTIDFIGHVFNCLKQQPTMGLKAMVTEYKPRHWYTTAEFWNLLFNNIFVVGGWIVFSHLLGAAFFFGIYFTTLTLSAAIFIFVFFVQHNFEGSYAHKTEGWSYLLGAIEGSSYLELPAVLQWFSANIGYHNIHHLSERIPNYNLEACHKANLHLLSKSKTLRLRDMPNCSKFILWDADAATLVSIDMFRQAAAATKAPAQPAAPEPQLVAEPSQAR